MKDKRILKTLPVIFTEEQMLKLGKEQMETLLFIDEIENQKKGLSSLYDEATAIAKKMKQGYEEKEVSCLIQFNCPIDGKKSLIREDTGECAEVSDMTTEELQEELNFQDEPEQAPKIHKMKELRSGLEMTPYKEVAEGA